MIKRGVIILTIILVVVVAIFSNPKKQRHITAVENFVREKRNDKMLYELDKTIINNVISVSDFEVLSLTVLTSENESRVIGIGGLGSVYIFPRKSLFDR